MILNDGAWSDRPAVDPGRLSELSRRGVVHDGTWLVIRLGDGGGHKAGR